MAGWAGGFLKPAGAGIRKAESGPVAGTLNFPLLDPEIMTKGTALAETLQREKIRSLRLSEPARVGPETSLGETLRAMKASHIGCALVCEEGRVVGILTERDVLNKVAGSSVKHEEPVRRLMTPRPRALRRDDTLGDAIRMMTEGGYRHVPLTDETGRDAGVVCAKDLVEFIAEHFPAEVVNLPPRLHQVSGKAEGA
jgi:CBS domain-containing protein